MFLDSQEVCGDKLDKIRTEIGKIKDKVIACKIEIKMLLSSVNKKMEQGSAKTMLTSSLATASASQTAIETDANKHHFFLRIFDILYCKY